jgi:uncharacterized membrane protein
MERRTLDIILTGFGFIVTVVLLVASGLLFFGWHFIDTNVHDQLAAQKVFFPPKGSEALDPKEFPGLQKYAGQQVVNGQQARAYADEFIAKHLEGVANGKTYSEVSAEALANPEDATLQQQAQTLFRGETLRGLLLYGYAFWTMGQVMLLGAIFSLVVAVITLILSLLGLRHIRRADPARSEENKVVEVPEASMETTQTRPSVSGTETQG